MNDVCKLNKFCLNFYFYTHGVVILVVHKKTVVFDASVTLMFATCADEHSATLKTNFPGGGGGGGGGG